MRDDEQRRAKKEKLFQFYKDPSHSIESDKAKTKSVAGGVKTLPKDDDLLNIDGSTFNARVYLEKHLKEKDLSDLMLEEKVLTEQIRSLDSEMQTLMYDNYSKFISATDTIRLMKSNFKYVEKEMDCLVKNMSSIRCLSDKIKDGLVGERGRVKSLISTQQTLNKFKHLAELPSRLRKQLAHSQWSEAIIDLNKAKFILKSYSSTPSFKNIRDDCSQLVCDIQHKVWDQFDRAMKPAEFLSTLKVLRHLGVHSSRLSEAFIGLARERLKSVVAMLQGKLLGEHKVDDSSTVLDKPDDSEHPSVDTSVNASSSTYIRPDILHFANLITDSILDELSGFVLAYTTLFAPDKSADGDIETDYTVVEILENRIETDSCDLSVIELESRLLELLREVMETFLRITEERFADEQYSCPDTALLVRGLDRIHGRIQIFTRSVSDAVSTLGSMNSSSIKQWDTDPIGLASFSAPNESSNGDPAEFGDQTVAVCQHWLTTALQLANRVAEARTQWYLDGLCLSATDSITDLRQKLVSMGTTARTSDGLSNQLSVLSESLNSSLASQLHERIKALEVFLNPENTFVSRSGFREQFTLIQLREKLVVGYLQFLLTFFEDLTKTVAGRVPGPILLLLAKLCLTWTTTGTIGQFMSTCEDLLSSGSKLWALGTSGHSSRPTHTSLTLAQMATFNCFITPTTPKELTDKFRETSSRLLFSFTRLEGTNVAQLLRKSVEARDWLKCLEPRSVRSVVKRVVEDLTALDHQISQLLPSNMRSKDRGSDSRSARSGFSSLRPSGSTHFLEAQNLTNPSGNTTAELDPALATQLRRLFTQRIDIFASVEANCESLLLGIIKIGLKTLVECVRLQTFGKFGLQQIQVDCRYLQIHLWPFVNDEKLIGMLLDDVVYSVVQRCVDPQLMEESIVDSICDRA